MKITVKLTQDQIVEALAHVWGCATSDVTIETADGIEFSADLDTTLKGAQKAERALTKASK